MGTLVISIPDDLKSYLKQISEEEKKPMSKIIAELIILRRIIKDISWDEIFKKFSKKMGKIRREDMWK